MALKDTVSKTVSKVINRFGSDATLRNKLLVTGAIDPLTGKRQTETFVETAIKAVTESYNSFEIKAGLFTTEDLKFIIKEEAKRDDQIIYNSIYYVVDEVRRTDLQNNSILYTLMCKRIS